MADDPSLPLARLADQLHGLSSLAETLTIRLLELEERLQAQQERMESILEAAQSSDLVQEETLNLRLEETEQRLAQLESLLQGGATLRAVPSFGSRARHDNQPFVADGVTVAGFGPEESGELELDPFPEEGEQPFMDERVA
jgi:hypothetical protein